MYLNEKKNNFSLKMNENLRLVPFVTTTSFVTYYTSRNCVRTACSQLSLSCNKVMTTTLVETSCRRFSIVINLVTR